jgi:ribonuclease-3
MSLVTRERELKQFQKVLGYNFNQISLLDTALTHSSYANECKKVQHNERLEFLGDSILSLVISEYLYRNYPKFTEGSLTKVRSAVVSEISLANLAKHIGLGKHILLGKGEELSGGRNRDSIMADAVESVIAAIYLDGGLDCASAFILANLGIYITRVIEGKELRDYKTDLQEILQKESGDDIEYRIVRDLGPAHDKVFVAQVFHDKHLIGEGEGKSKKEAEQHAAQKALEHMQK